MVTLFLLRAVALFVLFLFGMILGSFLNVLIYRLPRDMSPLKGFSMCPLCEHRLYPVDLVPVFSRLALKRRCRYCGGAISLVYPAVEVANGLLYVAVVLHFGWTPEAAAYAVICSCLLGIFVSDLQTMIIPDTFNVGMAAAGMLLIFVSDYLSIPDRLIGAACISVPMLIIALVSKGRAMGGGDIKMMAALGLCLGWKQMLAVLLIGSVTGSLTFFALSKTKLKMEREVPFGAFLALGGVICVLFGPEILGWYLGFFHDHEYYHVHSA